MPLTVEDRELIRELVARYDFAIDFGYCDEYARTFTPDGTFWVDGFGEGSIVLGRHTGRAALFDFCKLNFDAYKGQLRHWNNGVQIMEQHGGEVRMRSYMMGITVGMLGEAHILETGVYHDTLVKVGDDWFFQERHFICDPQFEHRGLDFDPAKFATDIGGSR